MSNRFKSKWIFKKGWDIPFCEKCKEDCIYWDDADEGLQTFASSYCPHCGAIMENYDSYHDRIIQ